MDFGPEPQICALRRRGTLNARGLAAYSTLTAIAIILSAAESLAPVPVPAPGLKLGLANVVTLIILMNDSNPMNAFLVTIVRCVLSSLLLGALSTVLFSLAGGLVSCAAMWVLLKRFGVLSPIGASVAGAVSHNITQLAVASLIAGDAAIFGYLPPMLALGAATGTATGYVAVKSKRILNLMKKIT